MKFIYKAADKKGKIKTGEIEAADKAQAQQELLEKDFTVLLIKQAKKNITFKVVDLIPIISKVSHIDKMLFAKHMAVMIKAGLTIREAVVTIEEQVLSKNFKKILKNIISLLDNGEPLAGCLSRYPKIFNELFINMVKIGESSGTLEQNLNYLADHLEKSQALRSRVFSASLYPFLILIATFGLGGTLSIFILPRLVPLFDSFKVKLPLSTRILMLTVKTIQQYWFFVILGFTIFIILILFLSNIKIIRKFYHKLFLSFPVIGILVRNTNLAQITRTLGTLLQSGITVVETIEITAKTTSNLIYKDILHNTSAKIKKGKSISSFLVLNPKLFPPTVSQMIRVGEKSGKLEETLKYLAEFYEKEVDNTTKNLSTILEPMLLITMGLVVAFVAVSIILPIYQITRSLRIK